MSYSFPPMLHRQAATGSAGVSSGTYSNVAVGKLSHRIFDPHKARREFPERWGAWCRENFRSSNHLADAFGVSEKTARLWMEGTNSPLGWAVDAAKEGRIEGVPAFINEVAA